MTPESSVTNQTARRDAMITELVLFWLARRAIRRYIVIYTRGTLVLIGVQSSQKHR